MADGGVAEGALSGNGKRILTVLGAVATGIGVVGFVTVVGGSILWLRFNAVAIPAEEAVAAVPHGELVAVGLSTLLPYIPLGLLVVLLAFLFAADNLVPTAPATDVTEQWTASRGSSATPVSVPAITTAEDDEVARIAMQAQSTSEAVERAADDTQDAARLGSKALADEHLKRANEAFERVQSLTSIAAVPLKIAAIDPDALESEAQAALERARAAAAKAESRLLGVRVRVVLSGLLLIVLEMGLAVIGGLPSFWHFMLLVALAVVLAGSVVTIGWRTRGFPLFGASLFVAVLLFGAGRTLFRTWDHPTLQPMALLRSGPDRGMIGYYIAETSERVYLARVDAKRVLHGHSFEESSPRILVVPRSSVVEIAIGGLMERRAGLEEAEQLLQELCADKVREPASASGAGNTAAGSMTTGSSKTAGSSSTGGSPPLSTDTCPPAN